MKDIHDFKNIIFDLGGVLLGLDYNRTVDEFKKHIKDFDADVFLGKEAQLSFFSDYEVGRVTTPDFRKKFCEHYRLDLSEAEFNRCWNAMIIDFPIERVLLLNRLRRSGKKIFLLSNINELHEFAVDTCFTNLRISKNIFDLFDKVYYSHRVGLRKPNIDIFEHVVQDSEIEKGDTVFIDDSLHHILSARKFGLEAIHLANGTALENHSFFSSVL